MGFTIPKVRIATDDKAMQCVQKP